MRKALRARIESLNTPGTWDHITRQVGWFCFSGLNEAQCRFLTEKYHIHNQKDGRIALVWLNHKSVEYVGEAIHDAVVSVK